MSWEVLGLFCGLFLVVLLAMLVVVLWARKQKRDSAKAWPGEGDSLARGQGASRETPGPALSPATSRERVVPPLHDDLREGIIEKARWQNVEAVAPTLPPLKAEGVETAFHVRAQSVPIPPPPDLVNHFPNLEVLELLGKGGMGTVYKARQTKLGRMVALKTLPSDVSRDSSFTDRFAREARALAQLNHPGIVAIYDFGEADGIFYFLMEYVDGMNLLQLRQAEAIDPERALQIVGQVCDALQYAHEEGVVHRDIKPANILIDRKGRVKIADFGLAKLLGATSAAQMPLTLSHQMMGTMHYMAPEQIEDALHVDHRADIYSLGVVLYELLTGGLPLGRFALPSEKAGVDTRLDGIVMRALEKEPGRRYQHVSEMRTALASVRPAGVQPLLQETVTHVMGSSGSSIAELEEKVRATGTQQLQGLAAIALLLPGLLAIVFGLALGGSISVNFVGLYPKILLGLIPIAHGTTLFFAWQKTRTLAAYEFGVIGSILAMLPVSPGVLIGLPAGIALFRRLRKPEVIELFQAQKALNEKIGRLAREDPKAIRDRLSGLAMLGLLVPGILTCCFWLVYLVSAMYYLVMELNRRNAPWTDVNLMLVPVVAALGISHGLLLIVGWRKMTKPAAHGFVVVTIVLAMLPLSPAFLLGLPMGIKLLALLLRPEVIELFQAEATTHRKSTE